MKAILLAAGVGSRISRAIDMPKSLLDVGGRPMIARTVELLQKHGFDVCVVVGYKGDDVRRALEGRGVTFYENPFYRVTNSLGSFWFARDFMCQEDTFIMNADVYWDEEILARIIRSPWEITVATDDSRALVGDFCYRVEDGIVTMYGKDLTEEQRTTESVGIAFVKASFMPTFRERMERMVADGRYDTWWDIVLYSHMDVSPVHAMDVSGLFWGEVDYIDDYTRILDHISGKDRIGASPRRCSPSGSWGSRRR